MKHRKCSYLVYLAIFGLISAAPAARGQAKLASADNLVEKVSVLSSQEKNLDAAFNANADAVYFVAAKGQDYGVFRAATKGGANAPLHVGAPFVAPRSLVVASDDQSIYVADPKATGNGCLFVLSDSAPGLPQVVAGTTGYKPRGVAIADENGRDTLYFTGQDPRDNQPGVFKMAVSGDNAPTVVAKGAPLAEPDGLTVARAGEVYVTDQGTKSVWKISGGQVASLVGNARLGRPAGVALTMDETALLVSALQAKGGAQVLVVNLKNGQTSSVTKVIGANPQAGGLHRARNSNSFAWSGIIRNVYGVYVRIFG